MNKKLVALKLFDMDDATMIDVVTKAWKSYINELEDIARDIYDSCIADYYAKYTPTVYKRHGHPEGYNLYQADVITNDDYDVFYEFDPDRLWKYGGKNGDEKREEVLSNVLSGIRGSTVRIKTKKKWPQAWRTSYPNEHSDKKLWNSKEGNTIDTIFDDFSKNIFKDTGDLLWVHIEKYV